LGRHPAVALGVALLLGAMSGWSKGLGPWPGLPLAHWGLATNAIGPALTVLVHHVYLRARLRTTGDRIGTGLLYLLAAAGGYFLFVVGAGSETYRRGSLQSGLWKRRS
jgi:hypothetical protein